MGYMIIGLILAVAAAANAKVCFTFTEIRDVGGPIKEVDFSKVTVVSEGGKFTVKGSVVVKMPIQSVFMAGYDLTQFEGEVPTRTFLAAPTRNICPDFGNPNLLYSTILERIGKKCPVAPGNYSMDGVELNQKVFRLTNPEVGFEYAGDILFVAESGTGNIYIKGKAISC